MPRRRPTVHTLALAVLVGGLAFGACKARDAEAMQSPEAAGEGSLTPGAAPEAGEGAPDPAADQETTSVEDMTRLEEGLPPETIVARVNGRAIRLSAIDQEIADELRQARSEYIQGVHSLRRQAIEAQVALHLLREEAHRQGMLTLEDYLRREVEERVEAPSAADVDKFFQDNLDGVPRAELADLEGEVREHLHMEKKQERLLEIVEELRKGAKIEIDLPRPRVRVRTIGPAMGPESAPVTIVMFSDFECPFCAEATSVVTDLMKRYEGKVRLVVRDFPLDSHPNARRAAEAARCADEQGRYWGMHEKLFAHQDALAEEALMGHARAVDGLDVSRFEECLTSGRMRILVEGDRRDGESAGVSGTPAFFVNGYPVAGLVESRELELIIESELRALERSGSLGGDTGTPAAE